MKKSFVHFVKTQILIMVHMRYLNFMPTILRHVFISPNFAPVLFSIFTSCASGIVLEGGLNRGSTNAVRQLAMTPCILRVIILLS
jgi:hypothetical protein